MFQDKYVFTQLASFLDRNHYKYLVRKYGRDRYVMRDLFEKTNFNEVKERDYPLIEGLFD